MTSPENPDQAPQPPHQQPAWAYPAWQPPRQGVPGWATALIALGTGVLGLIVGFVVPWLFIGFAFTALEGDDGYSDGDDYYVYDSDVTDAVEGPCDQLESMAAELPLFGPTDAGRAALGDLADQHRAIAEAIEGASDAEEVRMLATDWRTVATAIDTFSEALDGDPSARLEMPSEDGQPVSYRIYNGNDDCYVPTIVESLDPDLDDELYY